MKLSPVQRDSKLSKSLELLSKGFTFLVFNVAEEWDEEDEVGRSGWKGVAWGQVQQPLWWGSAGVGGAVTGAAGRNHGEH